MENIATNLILPRAAASAIEQASRIAPVVVLLGARQTGKTTLVRAMPMFKNWPYLTMDDFDLRVQAESQPEAVVARAPRMVLDEIQRARDLLIAVKMAVDADPAGTLGRFVLTGSANLLMMERVSETLAGRAVYVALWPFTRRERIGLGRTGIWSEILAAQFNDWTTVIEANRGPAVDWRTAAGLGGLPVPSHRLSGVEERALWFSGYVKSDTALAMFLAGETEPRGAHLANLVLIDLLAWRDLQATRPEVLYWRTATGVEVDFVIETPARLLPIEIKAATRVRVADAKGLELFLDEYPDLTDGALLLYAGSRGLPPDEKGPGRTLVAGDVKRSAMRSTLAFAEIRGDKIH